MLLISELGYIFVFVFRASSSPHNSIQCLQECGWVEAKGIGRTQRLHHSTLALSYWWWSPCSAQHLGGKQPPRDAAGLEPAKYPTMENIGLGQEEEKRRTKPESSLPSSMQQVEGTRSTPNPVPSPTTSPQPLATRWGMQSPRDAVLTTIKLFRSGRVFQALRICFIFGTVRVHCLNASPMCHSFSLILHLEQTGQA